MKTIIYGVIVVCLVFWIIKEHKESIKHRNGKKVLNLSEHEWISVLERSIEESWRAALLYGFAFGVALVLFVGSLR